MIVDEATITVKAGDGGDGRVSFRREKFITKGGPDGGDGGNGGSIFFLGVSDLSALRQFRYKKVFEADSGKPGMPKKKFGSKASDLEIKIPIGTLIKDEKTTESWEVLKTGERILIAQGGKGGRGNSYFRSSTNTTPKQFERGGRGQKRELKIELQLIADVGLIGLPNVGKSSLLNRLTKAQVPVANYPFTTLEPNLGVMLCKKKDLILADIPGLIEGASKGRGLGYKFLRHIKRTKMLAHCLAADTRNVLEDYKTVRKELAEFDQELTQKKEILVITKIDLLTQTKVDSLIKKLKTLKKEVVLTSIHQPETIKNLQIKLNEII